MGENVNGSTALNALSISTTTGLLSTLLLLTSDSHSGKSSDERGKAETAWGSTIDIMLLVSVRRPLRVWIKSQHKPMGRLRDTSF